MKSMAHILVEMELGEGVSDMVEIEVQNNNILKSWTMYARIPFRYGYCHNHSHIKSNYPFLNLKCDKLQGNTVSKPLQVWRGRNPFSALGKVMVLILRRLIITSRVVRRLRLPLLVSNEVLRGEVHH